MPQRELFTDQEWASLRETPQIVAVAMSLAAPSGIGGTLKEAMTLSKSLVVARNDINELIREVSARNEAKLAGDSLNSQLGRARRRKPESSQSLALDSLKGSIAILEAKCPNNLAPYKAWVRSIAVSVAEAAKEGGFLGFGGERVSPNERTFLEKIDAILESGNDSSD